MKKPLIILCTFLCLSLLVLYHITAPRGSRFDISPLPSTYKLAVLPLDSRPPCSLFTAQLGALAGIRTELPPYGLMDWYEDPAKAPLLQTWLTNNLAEQQGAVIATDLLSFGGLLHNRLAPLTREQENNLLTYLRNLRKQYPDKDYYVYSIIPRMLVSDQILPDSWYQWHLMQWSILMDKKLQGLPYDEKQYASLQAEIPMEIKWKYICLYRENARFNTSLLHLAQQENFTDLIIGQDDAQKFGLPNYNRWDVQQTLTSLHNPANLHITQGADELGAIEIAKIFCRQHNYRPKIFVTYSSPATAKMLLHFVPLSLEELVQDKLALLNVQRVAAPEEADLVLFVHCGSEQIEDYNPAAQQVKTLMQIKPVALVDLAMDFDGKEVLLPNLIANKTPLVRLAAYAGWNTASNSLGTALAQGIIVTGQAKYLPKAQLPSLYAANVRFTCERFLDDWAYQKQIRYKIAEFKNATGILTEDTDPYTELVEGYINRELNFYKEVLLRSNLRLYPFYQDASGTYYLQDLDLNATLPWHRTFEIKLLLKPTFGKISLTNA